MKIRQGFVSNSSSSSFCIYGTSVSRKQLEKAFPSKDGEEFNYWDIGEKLPKGWGCWDPHDYEEFSIGRSYASMGDDETGKQFKESVESKMKELFGEDIECLTMKEAWRDD